MTKITIDSANANGRSISEDPVNFLLKSDLIRNGELSNAGYLLFVKNESTITTIELGRFQTDTVIKDSARSKTDLLTQVKDVLAFVKKHINKEIIVTGEARHTEKTQTGAGGLLQNLKNLFASWLS